LPARRQRQEDEPVAALSWAQGCAWRLARHSLLERADRGQLLDVVTRLGALHAQVMSAAELAAWARVRDVTPGDVRDALWADRMLVKTWAMRGTLHLLVAEELPLYAAALSTRVGYRKTPWLKYHNLTLAEIDALIAAVPAALDGRCLTREELADEVARLTGQPALSEKLRSGWGDLLKPAANRGSLCFGPSRGQAVTFVRPDQWLGGWRELDPQEALREVARRFVHTYGPTTRDEFARWWGVEPREVRAVFESLAGELATVEVEGWRASVLAEDVERLRATGEPETVRLLPNFDPYVVAFYRQSDYLLPAELRPRVYRAGAWVSPAVLVDGRIAGVWAHEKRRGQVAVTVEHFAPLPPAVEARVEEEARRLGAFLGASVELRVAAA
jgi:hypothetical protein